MLALLQLHHRHCRQISILQFVFRFRLHPIDQMVKLHLPTRKYR
jgi:hypothetical protein